MTWAFEMVSDTPGTVTEPPIFLVRGNDAARTSFSRDGSHRQGIAMLEQYVAAVREAVGMEIPLSMDHLGHLGVKSIIGWAKHTRSTTSPGWKT